LTRPKEILFDPKGKKLKNLGFLSDNFPNPDQNQRWLTRLDPGQIFFDPDPSLVHVDVERYLEPQQLWKVISKRGDQRLELQVSG